MPKSESGLQVETMPLQVETKDFLRVQHQGRPLLFYPYPIAYDRYPNTELEKKLQERGLKKPSLAMLVSLMHAAFATPETASRYVKQVRDAFTPNILGSSIGPVSSFTGLYKVLGGYIVFENLSFDPKGNPIIDYEKFIDGLLYPNNLGTRKFIADSRYDTAERTIELVSILAGEEGLRKLDDKNVFECGWDLRDCGDRQPEKTVFNATISCSDKKPVIWINTANNNLGTTFGRYET